MKQSLKATGQQIQTNAGQSARDTIRGIVGSARAYVKNASGRMATDINRLLDGISDYHGATQTPPSGAAGKLWLSIPSVSSSSSDEYIFKKYYVDQQPANWPSANECVTASTIQAMNMMQDILAEKFNVPALPHFDLISFAAMFDAHGLRNWLTRPPAHVPIVGGMLTPADAKKVLEAHSKLLRTKYGYGYRVELTAGNTVDNLIANLKNGYPTTIHISQDVKLFQIENGEVRWSDWRALIGDAPHTVALAGYDATNDIWLILDPAPRSTWYTRWKTEKLMDLWGRQFIGYPPRFAMTTLIPDTTDARPKSPFFTIPIVTGPAENKISTHP